jgi:hypothetical protein
MYGNCCAENSATNLAQTISRWNGFASSPWTRRAAWSRPAACWMLSTSGTLCQELCMVQISYRCGPKVCRVYTPTPTSISSGRLSRATMKEPMSLWLWRSALWPALAARNSRRSSRWPWRAGPPPAVRRAAPGRAGPHPGHRSGGRSGTAGAGWRRRASGTRRRSRWRIDLWLALGLQAIRRHGFRASEPLREQHRGGVRAGRAGADAPFVMETFRIGDHASCPATAQTQAGRSSP